MKPQREPQLWIVDPSVRSAEEQGVAEILRDWPGASRVFRPALRPGDVPAGAEGYETDGVVLLGSAASVHDCLPWIPALEAWLRPVLTGERRIPLFGVCFGHQLIAHLAGGRVGYLDARRTKAVGVESTELAGGRLLEGAQSLRVVVSHREEVQQVPAGYRVTARRPRSPIDGLEHETLPIYSFQFHPEAREQFAREAGIDPAAIDARLRADGRRLLRAFLEEVWSRTPGGSALGPG